MGDGDILVTVSFVYLLISAWLINASGVGLMGRRKLLAARLKPRPVHPDNDRLDPR